MPSNNGSGKWQLAFWVITVICGAWLLTLTQGVIANDRLRASEDNDIRLCLNTKLSDIAQRLVRIETKLDK